MRKRRMWSKAGPDPWPGPKTSTAAELVVQCLLFRIGRRTRDDAHRGPLPSLLDELHVAPPPSEPRAALVNDDVAEPRSEPRGVLQLVEMSVSANVGVLQHVLCLGIVAQQRAPEPEEPLVVPAHHRL